jgi:hypothetical protein
VAGASGWERMRAVRPAVGTDWLRGRWCGGGVCAVNTFGSGACLAFRQEAEQASVRGVANGGVGAAM